MEQHIWEGCRWLVRDGNQFYVSEKTFRGAVQILGEGNGKQHVFRPAGKRWAPYDPKPPYHIAFDAQHARFAPHTFEDIRAVGWYLYKDTLIPSYTGFKWYALEVDAVVHRPERPSEHLAMVKMPAMENVPEFYLSTCEVPYVLWKNVFRRARSNTFVRDPRGFLFDQDGDMGSMDYGSASHSLEEPVTDVTLYDVAAWCNALSTLESRTPCYYEDPDFKTPFHFVKQSPTYATERSDVKLHVRWERGLGPGDRAVLPADLLHIAGGREAEAAPAGTARRLPSNGVGGELPVAHQPLSQRIEDDLGVGL